VTEVTDDGIVRVHLIGECVLCALQDKTAEGMEMTLRNAVPGFQKIEMV
jgi:Fe-S cluster biogenesis protein NfuA